MVSLPLPSESLISATVEVYIDNSEDGTEFISQLSVSVPSELITLEELEALHDGLTFASEQVRKLINNLNE